MPDAPAPAAAPAASPSPTSGGSSSAGATPASAPATSGAPAGGAAPAAAKLPWGEGPLRVPLKWNGKDETAEFSSVDDLAAQLQRAKLANQLGVQRKELEQRLQEAEARSKAEAEAFKADPFAFMASRGHDVDGLLKARILENARRQQLPPDQLAAEESKRATEPLQRKLTEAEKKVAAYEQQMKAARLEAWAAEEWGRLEPQFLSAAKAAGIEMDEGFLNEISDEAATWLDAGLPIDPATIFKTVSERTEQNFWGRLNKQKAAAVYAKLSPELRQAVVQMAVEEFRKARSPANPAAGRPPAPPPKPAEPRRFMDEREWKQALKGG